MGAYREMYDRSLTDPGGFWADAAAGIDWTQPPDRVLDDVDAPLYRWFPDAQLNTCFNAVDRHVLAGQGEQPALTTTARLPAPSPC